MEEVIVAVNVNFVCQLAENHDCMRNMTVNMIAEWTQTLETEIFLQASLHWMAVVKCTCSLYNSSAACVSGVSFSRMASLCPSSFVGQTRLLHIRQWQLQDIAPALILLGFEQLVQGCLLTVQKFVDAVP